MTEIVLKTGTWQTNAGLLGLITVFNEGRLPYDITSEPNKLKFDSEILNDFSLHFWNAWFKRSKSQVVEYILATQLYPDLIANQTIDDTNTEILTKNVARMASILKDKFISKEKDKTKQATALGNTLKQTNTNIDFYGLNQIYECINDKDTPLDIKIDTLKQNQQTLSFLTNDYFIYYLTISKLKTIELNKIIPQAKGISRIGFAGHLVDEFQNYINTGLEIYQTPSKKIKTTCMRCATPLSPKQTNAIIATLTEDNNNNDEKKSFLWNQSTNTSIQECFICQLAEYTLPLSLNFIFSNGLFINDASSIKQLVQTNKQLTSHVNNTQNRAKMSSFLKTILDNQRSFNYDFADIQVIRFINKDNNVKINPIIFTSKTLQFITKNENNQILKHLYAARYTRYNETEYIIDTIMTQISNNQVLDDLIIHMLKTEPSEYINTNAYYNSIHDLIKLNRNLKENMSMETSTKETLAIITHEGQQLRKALYAASYDNKINGIAHKVLMSIRSRNYNRFMDTVLHTYLMLNRNVPSEIATLKKETFTDAAYAFAAGLMSYENKANQKQEDAN